MGPRFILKEIGCHAGRFVYRREPTDESALAEGQRARQLVASEPHALVAMVLNELVELSRAVSVVGAARVR